MWADEWQGTLARAEAPSEGPSGTTPSAIVTESFTMASLTWSGDAPEAAYIRYRQTSGLWSAWQELEVGAEEGPDSGTEGSVDGWTEIVSVGSQDEAQFALKGSDLEAVDVTLVDTANRTKPFLMKVEDALFGASVEAAPAIHSRSEWDPAGTCVPKLVPPDTIKIEAAVVHHTVSGTADRDSIPGTILAICLFHRNSRGWDDIGYNFLVDQFGRQWEGRAGGMERGVRGAHTKGFNSFSFGVAMIGDYRLTPPTSEAVAAVADIISWKFSLHGVPATGTVTVEVTDSTLFPDGTFVDLERINGHKDLGATSCPGDAGYLTLAEIRSDVVANSAPAEIVTAPEGLAAYHPDSGRLEMERFVLGTDGQYFWEANLSGSVYTDLLEGSIIWSGELGSGTGMDVLLYSADTSRFQFWTGADQGTSWTKFFDQTGTTGWTHLVPGDFDGNGVTDLLFYKASTGLLRFYTVEGSSFKPMSSVMYGNIGWSHIVPGDFDGDGSDDLMWYRADDGLLRFYEIDDNDQFNPITEVLHGNTGWSQIPSGDFDGVGNDDLLFYRAGDGLIRYYTVLPGGQFAHISDVDHDRPDFDLVIPGNFDDSPEDELMWHRREETISVTTRFTPEGDEAFGLDPDRVYFTSGIFARMRTMAP